MDDRRPDAGRSGNPATAASRRVDHQRDQRRPRFDPWRCQRRRRRELLGRRVRRDRQRERRARRYFGLDAGRRCHRATQFCKRHRHSGRVFRARVRRRLANGRVRQWHRADGVNGCTRPEQFGRHDYAQRWRCRHCVSELWQRGRCQPVADARSGSGFDSGLRAAHGCDRRQRRAVLPGHANRWQCLRRLPVAVGDQRDSRRPRQQRRRRQRRWHRQLLV